VESAAGDEQDMVGLHRPVFGGNRGALDQRQQIALHALAADIGAARIRRAQTLSISSRKTMPFSCTASSAAAFTASSSSSLSASSPDQQLIAFATVILAPHPRPPKAFISPDRPIMPPMARRAAHHPSCQSGLELS
jgi:hypothetical protein